MTQHAQTKWTIDTNHSAVQFKVKHLGLANVAGTFKTFKGEATTGNEDFKDANINFEMDTHSIDTKLEERDNHLKSSLFFDAEKFPKITFEGQLKKNGSTYTLEGDLTIRDTKKNVTMDVDYNGIGTGRFGDVRAGFEVTGKINRKDFGLTWSLLTEAGSLVVGEDIKLHFDIELLKQAN